MLSLVVGILFWLHPSGLMLLVLAVSLLVRMALNALDGMMARTYNMQSRKGEILNELGDVLADIFMFLPLIQIESLNSFLLIAFLLLSLINEFVGILGKAVSGERRYEGPMGKSDRALVIGIACLILYFYPAFNYIDYIFWGISILLIVSTVIRVKKMLHENTDKV